MMFLLALLACGEPAPTAPPAWNTPKETQLHRYLVDVRLEPDPPPMGELFEVVATVKTPEGEPVEDARVALDALMPQHGHGMATDPEDDPGECAADGACKHPKGEYRARGFKFHMGGAWTVTVDVQGGPRGPDSTSFVYEMPG